MSDNSSYDMKDTGARTYATYPEILVRDDRSAEQLARCITTFGGFSKSGRQECAINQVCDFACVGSIGRSLLDNSCEVVNLDLSQSAQILEKAKLKNRVRLGINQDECVLGRLNM